MTLDELKPFFAAATGPHDLMRAPTSTSQRFNGTLNKNGQLFPCVAELLFNDTPHSLILHLKVYSDGTFLVSDAAVPSGAQAIQAVSRAARLIRDARLEDA